MGMHKFDFLSSAPQNIIFRKNSNKTNLGGVLSFIYLIIMLIITAYYLAFYFIEENYTIEYLYYEEISTEDELVDKYNNPKYNQNFLFKIELYENESFEGVEADERFIIKDLFQYNTPTIKNFGSIDKKITDVYWVIVYDCLDDIYCQIDRNKTKADFLTFQFIFQAYKLDHQNTTSPFYRQDNENSRTVSTQITLNEPIKK